VHKAAVVAVAPNVTPVLMNADEWNCIIKVLVVESIARDLHELSSHSLHAGHLSLLLLKIFGLPSFCWFWPATEDKFYSAAV
jgi:hypothetical protein